MPTVRLEIPEVHENITRVVNQQVLAQFMAMTGISPEISVRFVGFGHAMSKSHSTLKPDAALNRLATDQKLVISVEEDYIEAESLTTAVIMPDNNLTFLDESLQVYIKPVYNTVQAVITVAFHASDRIIANSWVHEVKTRINRGIVENFHNIDYHYPIPIEIMMILQKLYTLREEHHGYGDTIGQWLNQCFVSNFTVLTNQVGEGSTFVIKESQTGVQGWPDYDFNPPKPVPDEKGGGWITEFTYSFVYQRCESFVLHYPIAIHNQELSEDYRETAYPPVIEDFLATGSRSNLVADPFRFHGRVHRTWAAYPGIPVPYYDDWVPKYHVEGATCLLRFLMQVDVNAPRALLTLSELGLWQLKKNALAFMKRRPLGMLRPYDSVFQIKLHRWDQLVDCNDLIISPTLDIFTTDDMNPRANYHLVISLVHDITKLTQAAIDDLIDDDSGFVSDYFDFISSINPGLHWTVDMLPRVRTVVDTTETRSGGVTTYGSKTDTIQTPSGGDGTNTGQNPSGISTGGSTGSGGVDITPEPKNPTSGTTGGLPVEPDLIKRIIDLIKSGHTTAYPVGIMKTVNEASFIVRRSSDNANNES